MDRLQSMSIFLAVVDEGGLAAAARRLKISPPVVTRAIGDLEASMGVRLLVRTTRVVRVTDVGMRYANDCRRILADIAATEQAASGAHGTPRGRLVITAPVLFGELYVTRIVTEYLRRYPDTEVECRFLDRVVNMMDEGVDTAVRIGVLPDSSYQAIQVGHVRQVIVGSRAYLEQRGVPQQPDELKHHDLICAQGVTPGLDWRFENNGKGQVLRVKPRMTSTSNAAAIAASLDGFGLTRVISYMVARHIAAGTLTTVLSPYEPAPLPVSVVHHEGRQSTPKIRAFIDLAIDMLRSDETFK